jgi:hypothetical protein
MGFLMPIACSGAFEWRCSGVCLRRVRLFLH